MDLLFQMVTLRMAIIIIQIRMLLHLITAGNKSLTAEFPLRRKSRLHRRHHHLQPSQTSLLPTITTRVASMSTSVYTFCPGKIVDQNHQSLHNNNNNNNNNNNSKTVVVSTMPNRVHQLSLRLLRRGR